MFCSSTGSICKSDINFLDRVAAGHVQADVILIIADADAAISLVALLRSMARSACCIAWKIYFILEMSRSCTCHNAQLTGSICFSLGRTALGID